MRLRLTLLRDDGTSEDIVVTADASATLGGVAAAIAERDPRGAGRPAGVTPALRLLARSGAEEQWTPLPSAARLGEGRIASGAAIAVGTGEARGGRSGPAVAVLEAAGREHPLPRGSWILGRRPSCDIVLGDPLVSGEHARIEVSDRVELVDLGSANGIVVDGERVARLVVDDGAEVLLGGTRVRMRMLGVRPPRAPSAAHPGEPIAFNRAPRLLPRFDGETFTAPVPPAEREPSPFPWLAMLAPLFAGTGLALLLGRWSMLLLVLLSPAMLLGNHLATRARDRRQRRRTMERFDERLAALRGELDAARVGELEARAAAFPAAAEAIDAAIERGPLLWSRRPGEPGFLGLRLGTGAATSRSRIEAPRRGELAPEAKERLDALLTEYRRVPGAPIAESLAEAGAIGVAGPAALAEPVLGGLIAQLAALHSPEDLAIAAIVPPRRANGLEWLKWLPHCASPGSPIGARPHLADTRAGAAALLAAIDGLLASPREPRRPMLVLVASEDAPAARARLLALAEGGPAAGVLTLWIAETAAALPAACRTVVEVTGAAEARVSFLARGERLEPVRTEPVAAATAMRLGRALAPVVDAAGAAEAVPDLPRDIALAALLGHELLDDPAAVVERWREHDSLADRDAAPPRRRIASGLRAVVGASGGEPMHLDLRAHGPHALLAGTTGAGKSEFLQSWVLATAAAHSPDRVTFLLVDYKGGAAFGDCARLPHCVGLVTDLGPHLARRALTSLAAELRHRERLLAARRAKDLLELERRGDPAAPPALVIVIDEFAALARELPAFVDGVVDLAQRGRSLGIHLVMATQRPAGVIRESIRANTNLRIALRMADEADSRDVVGTGEAARIDAALPGRGLVRVGAERSRAFQAAYAGGRSDPGRGSGEIVVGALRFGGDIEWPAASPPAGLGLVEEGASDERRLVASIGAAATLAGVPPPRRPWLDELPAVVDLAGLMTGDDAAIAFGLSDVPEAQRRRTAAFRPDADGHLAILGTSGAGKSAALRALAVATASTPAGGPVQVYALDFAGGGLRMLEPLPHVGAVIAGDEPERVERLLRRLRSEVEDRSRRWSEHAAASLAEYRANAAAPAEPRILLLIDGLPAFREEWEAAPGRPGWADAFRAVLSGGRRLGVHIAFTADRPGAVPSGIASLVARRVVLRLAEESGYALLGLQRDVLGEGSPAGRCIVDGLETQLGVPGGPSAAEQAAAITALGARLAAAPRAPAIQTLPREVPAARMPATVDGLPVLGLSDETLAPIGFAPAGTLLLSGPPGSGRSAALDWLVAALRRADPGLGLAHLGPPRSPLAADACFAARAAGTEPVAALARELADGIAGGARCAIVVEGIADFLQTPADAPLAELVRQARRHAVLLIAENEASGWSGSWPLLAEVRAARRGLLLRPEPMDGELLLRTPLRPTRAAFPPGRGLFVERGTAVRVQLPHIRRDG